MLNDEEVLNQARLFHTLSKALTGAHTADKARLEAYNAAIVAALEERKMLIKGIRRMIKIAEDAGGIAPEIDAVSALSQIYDQLLEVAVELDLARKRREIARVEDLRTAFRNFRCD